MLHLKIIPGLRDEDDCTEWFYIRRNKDDDMEMTRAYYKENPPKVGDLVVVLHTYAHTEMEKPHVTTIDAITDRGRLVVNHNHECWAGKSFWKSGQNCKAPTGQCWLVPAELYRDIPLSHKVRDEKFAQALRAKRQRDKLSVSDMVAILGNTKKFMEDFDHLRNEYNLTTDQALGVLNEELQTELEYLGRRAGTGMRITRKMIRSHIRFSAENNPHRLANYSYKNP